VHGEGLIDADLQQLAKSPAASTTLRYLRVLAVRNNTITEQALEGFAELADNNRCRLTTLDWTSFQQNTRPDRFFAIVTRLNKSLKRINWSFPARIQVTVEAFATFANHCPGLETLGLGCGRYHKLLREMKHTPDKREHTYDILPHLRRRGLDHRSGKEQRLLLLPPKSSTCKCKIR
jgi:hypothetical protein